jgi:hypothetical protein
MVRIKSERRIHPRVDHTLPIKVAVNGYDFATSTHNISCVGAYCRIPKYMPPFTKVMVKLSLPIVTDAGAKDYRVECKGVVVRTEDESTGGFNIAIFFNEINDTQRKKISQYIAQLLPKESLKI